MVNRFWSYSKIYPLTLHTHKLGTNRMVDL